MRTLNIFAKTTLALAMVSAANGVLAYFPANNDDTDPGFPAIYWAGYSPPTPNVQAAVIGTVCDPDLDSDVSTTNDIFLLLSRSNYWAVACVLDNGLPNNVPITPRILIHKRDAGGSGVGVGPVQQWLWIDFQATTAVNCATNPGSTIIAGEMVQRRTCGNSDVSHRPTVGSSDIEPRQFVIQSLNSPSNLPHYGCGAAPGPINAGAVPFDPTGVVLDDKPVAQLLFNTPVNLAFYLALQDSQFGPAPGQNKAICRPDAVLDASVPPRAVPNPANPFGYLSDTTDTDAGLLADGIINGNEEECMPSLTGLHIRSIMAARLTDPRRIFNPNGLPLILQDGYDPTIAVCRRVPGSGSQAVYNLVMHNSVCAATPNATEFPANAAVGPLFGCGGTLGDLRGVCENSGSGDVANCLEAYHRGTVATSNPAPADRRFAIGILSLESNSINPGGGVFVPPRDFRYIKIDQVPPTLREAHRGGYYFYGEYTFQNTPAAIPVGCVLSTGGVSPAPTAAQAAIIDSIRVALSAPSFQVEKNLEIDHPFHDNCNPVVAYDVFEGGWLALPCPPDPDPALDLEAKPVNAFSRQGNTCQFPILATCAPGMIITTPKC